MTARVPPSAWPSSRSSSERGCSPRPPGGSPETPASARCPLARRDGPPPAHPAVPAVPAVSVSTTIPYGDIVLPDQSDAAVLDIPGKKSWSSSHKVVIIGVAVALMLIALVVVVVLL